MILLKPLQVTDAILTSTNVPENDYPAYDPAATYNTGDRVTVADAGVHKNFECLADATTGIYPPDDSTKWLDLGADNAWAMFDTKVGTQTQHADQIAVSFNPGQIINAVGLVNLAANSVTVTVTDPNEGVVYQRTQSAIDTGATDWYGYFFDPIERKTALAFLDLPAYGSASIDVSIDYAGDTAKVGALVIGTQAYLGETRYGVKLGILDYSKKDVDVFGNWQVVERGFSDTADFDIELKSSLIGQVKQALSQMRATPALYVGHPDYPETHVFGYFRDFQINFSTPVISDVTITVEGLT